MYSWAKKFSYESSTEKDNLRILEHQYMSWQYIANIIDGILFIY